MERLIAFFVDRPLVVNCLVGVIILSGYMAATRTPLETFPNVTIPTLTVTALLPGASARDVETKVAIPLQDAIEELDGVKVFHTVVSDSMSVTTVELYDEFETDRIIEAERDLATLIDGINDFPPEMENEPTIRRLNPRKFPVVEVALAGPTHDVVLAAKLLERKLERLDTVSRVMPIGLQDPEVRILVDPARAREHGVTLLDIVGSIERRNVSSTGGLLKTAGERRQVVLWSRFEEPGDVGSTILRFFPSGSVLRIDDVARIELGREDTGLLSHTNAKPGISMIVIKREDAGIVDAVNEIIETVENADLPASVEAEYLNDSSIMARDRVDLMLSNGIFGAAIVAGILFLFLTPATAVWVLIAIPVVFLGALAMFPIVGFSINMVTLTGMVIVLGMVVDGAVVVGERIVSNRQAGLPARDASIRGASEMSRPVIAAAVTTMLAFLPMWALGGMSGRLIFAMPAVVMTALAISLLDSFLILPAHMATARNLGNTRKRAFVEAMEKRYRRMLSASLRHRAIVMTVFFMALVIVFQTVMPQVPVTLYPQDDSDAIFIQLDAPLGTPLEQTEAVVTSIEKQIPDLLGSDLLGVTARIGHQIKDREGFRERGSAEHEAVITLLLQPRDLNQSALTWVESLQANLIYPEEVDLHITADQPGPPVGEPITVHISSDDDSLRRAAAMEVVSWLDATDGVLDSDLDERPGTPQIELNLDYRKLALYGLDATDVAKALNAAFHGIPASEHRALEDTTDFRVMFDPSARRSLDGLLETPVRTQRGNLVLLRDVVAPVEIPAVSRIHHRDGMRTATVTAQFTAASPHTALSMATLLEEELFPRFEGIPDLEIRNGGEAIETRKTTADMLVAAVIAFVGITLIITLMLGSFLEAVFVVAIIPFSVASVILVFFLHGRPLSMFALLGTIGLAGVVVNASIVMVDSIHRRLLTAGQINSKTEERNIVMDAVVTRFRPILVTTLTTLGGVLPTAYGLGGYDIVVSPMSLAVGWGLAISTIVTLFLVPCLYTIASDVRNTRIKTQASLMNTIRLRRESGAPTSKAPIVQSSTDASHQSSLQGGR
ncbi:efflux RND transporter permease subunit [Myxococcota bacterium]|nr:efflux RND transporter permease subunit [Myxococcota bacterium]